MFEIIDENNTIILSDNDYTRLRTTALLLAKETKNGFVPMFTEENVDKSITKHSECNTETTNQN